MTLRISADLEIPDQAVTETFAILAKRGMGKTNTGVVMAEEMIGRGHQVVAIDPTGVWWGLRSSADGRRAGLSVVIFGGEHADVPLEPTSGELLADLVVDESVSCVLDVSLLRKGEQVRFFTTFAERLYHRNRQPLHLVIDEADRFCPQSPQKGTERALGAAEDLVRLGRARGIGVTLISQRSAVLNKNVLTQAEVLVALRMTGPQDQAAIAEWVKFHGDLDKRNQLMATLPSLPVGTAVVWSPGWLELFRQVEVRKRHTFDSSATPKVGERAREPRARAEVDMDRLRQRMAATIERAVAEDPKQLQRRITELEAELAAARAAREVVIQRVEVPVLSEADHFRMEASATSLRASRDELADLVGQLDQRLGVLADLRTAATPTWPLSEAPNSTGGTRRRGDAHRVGSAVPATTASGASSAFQDGEVRLKAGARRILAALARHHPMKVTRAQAGALSGFKVSGGTFQSYWSSLKTSGLIEEIDGQVSVTVAGLATAGVEPSAPASTEELLEVWRGALKAGARHMLDLLVEAYPQGLSRTELVERAGFSISGGTFQSYLSSLRRNGRPRSPRTPSGPATPSSWPVDDAVLPGTAPDRPVPRLAQAADVPCLRQEAMHGGRAPEDDRGGTQFQP
jgi:hypothetical protein